MLPLSNRTAMDSLEESKMEPENPGSGLIVHVGGLRTKWQLLIISKHSAGGNSTVTDGQSDYSDHIYAVEASRKSSPVIRC